MPVYLGLDCGGSSSRAMALDQDGQVIHQGQAGSANLVSTPERRLRSNLLQATRDCESADFICGCFAGLMTDDDRHRAESYLSALYPHARVHAEPDFAAAYAASENGTDICVIAGTGSLICSRINGRMVKSGGRGFILGDEGSAFHCGREALLHYLKAPQQASEQMKEALLKLFETLEEGPIVSKLYLSPSPPSALAKVAKALGQDARAGHEYAVQIIQNQMASLATVVESHIGRYFSSAKRIRITLAGGLWQNAPQFRNAFTEVLEQKLPTMNLEVQRIVKPPVYGAVMLAKEMANVN